MNPDLDRIEGTDAAHGVRNGVLLGFPVLVLIVALIATLTGLLRLTPAEWYVAVLAATAVWSVVWGALTRWGRSW